MLANRGAIAVAHHWVVKGENDLKNAAHRVSVALQLSIRERSQKDVTTSSQESVTAANQRDKHVCLR